MFSRLIFSQLLIDTSWLRSASSISRSHSLNHVVVDVRKDAERDKKKWLIFDIIYVPAMRWGLYPCQDFSDKITYQPAYQTDMYVESERRKGVGGRGILKFN